jgi:hypothetical protein
LLDAAGSKGQTCAPVWPVAVLASLAAFPYYERRNVSGFLHVRPPAYLTTGDVRAIDWLAQQRGDDVVLTRSDISPWMKALRV